jgi:hypothetical protein
LPVKVQLLLWPLLYQPLLVTQRQQLTNPIYGTRGAESAMSSVIHESMDGVVVILYWSKMCAAMAFLLRY